jgi:pimeloyl-ACP methyl ester carboxylesterase
MVAMVAVPGGLASGASAEPTATALRDPAAVRVPARYLHQQVRWQPCDFDFLVRSIVPFAPVTRCADVVVPMDWRHPDDHPDISLGFALSLATGRSQGLLTLNPGGPGVEALDATAFFATERPRMFAEFDLLGFDPRGFGRSTAALCHTSSDAVAALPTVLDPRVRSRAAHRAEVAAARLEARGCADELNRFVGTQQTVDDLEFLRAYLQARRPAGDTRYDRLNYIGYSYGTWLGAWYADTYPQRTGRFLLDSNMNWTATMDQNQSPVPSSMQRRRDRMFFPWVARQARTYRLGSSATAVRRSYERIRAGVLRSHRDGRSPVTVTDLDRDLLLNLYSNVDFSQAAEVMLEYEQWAEPAGTPRTPGVRSSAGRAADDDDVTWEASMAVRCNDSAWSRNVAAAQRRTDAATARYPFVGYWDALTMCTYWPYPPVRRTLDLRGAPTVLMVQSEGDPATGYEGALAAHRATPGRTRLVSVADEGQHGLYLSGVSPCVERIGDAFLFRGRLPAADTVCRTTPLPGERTVHPLRGPVAGAVQPSWNRVQGSAERPRPTRSDEAVQKIRRRVARAKLG